MAKKILGSLFFAGVILMLIGSVANGTLFSDQGSAAATYGAFLGRIIPMVLYILSGGFLFTFDNAAKLNYIDGFKKRSKQSSELIVFIVAYGVLVLFSAVGAGGSYADSYITYMIGFVIAIIPYIIPLLVFVALLQIYALPHWASKKYFLNNDVALNEYLSVNEIFYTYSDDNSVLATNKALFFPQLLCVVPFDQIASAKLVKQLWEQDVYINLFNGKKICIVTKHYDHIMVAINANTQAQQ